MVSLAKIKFSIYKGEYILNNCVILFQENYIILRGLKEIYLYTLLELQ